MIQLEPCPSCKRHVTTDERACPFCRAPLSDAFRALPPRLRPRTRLGLRASFAFGVTVAAGCGGKESTVTDAGAAGPTDAGVDSGTIVLQMGELPDPTLHIDAGITLEPFDAGVFVDDEAIGVPIYKASPP